jgi:hypothetical protein
MMAIKSSAKLLHLPPPQFDLLLQELEAQTPPKTQTLFSMRQVVERLYDFITRSLERHYSYEELAVIIHASLVKMEDVGTVPEIKGATLKQYFLEAKRERDVRSASKRKSGAAKDRNPAGIKMDLETGLGTGLETPIAGDSTTASGMESTIDVGIASGQRAGTKRLSTAKASTVELAY